MKNYFSFIVPAHNESKCIAKTIESLSNLVYPKDLYEVNIIENGSSDNTYSIAKKFAKNNVRVFQSCIKGVSRARNYGLSKISKKTEWVIFLDADTYPQKNFLKELSKYLEGLPDAVIGTTRLIPSQSTISYRLWYRFYDLTHRLFKTAMGVIIFRPTVDPRAHFDEKLNINEDTKFIHKYSKRDAFFYFNTKLMISSVRRFEKLGWWSPLYCWFLGFFSSDRTNERRDYSVIR